MAWDGLRPRRPSHTRLCTLHGHLRTLCTATLRSALAPCFFRWTSPSSYTLS